MKAGKDWAVLLCMYWLLLGGYQIGGEGSGYGMGNGWTWFLEAWYDSVSRGSEKAKCKMSEGNNATL